MMNRFALIGVAGYIAPRHLKAISDTGSILTAALDKSDSVGILDSYFPDCSFFTEQEQFDRFCSRVKGTENNIDWLSVCTPNHTHDAFVRYGLRLGADVICEKPVVLNPWNVEALLNVERETGRRAYCILQLRLHDRIEALKRMVEESRDEIFDVELTYVTPRGKWYYASWKGDESKSGGVATNIGIHFFDMLQWVFGPVQKNTVHVKSFDRVAGYMELKKARVRYFLSINADCLPSGMKDAGLKTYRAMSINGECFDFSEGFTELHTRSYEQILSGNGFRISEALPSIQTVYEIRKADPVGLKGDYHPLANLKPSKHPFIG